VRDVKALACVMVFVAMCFGALLIEANLVAFLVLGVLVWLAISALKWAKFI